MSTLSVIIRRNVKLFFHDKGMFFSALITPVILLVLYATFLGDIYHDTFTSYLPPLAVDASLIDALVGGQLISSILAVSCVTVAFCANFLMVQDKVCGVNKDFLISPVSPALLALGYYVATLLSTLIIAAVASALCLSYLATLGWYLALGDLLLLMLDIVLLALFGTALSSIVNVFLTTQGQISAVGTIVSSGYGFLCGAYMPISNFAQPMQYVISLLPGTYGTSLLRNHALQGVLREMQAAGVPQDVLDAMRQGMDCSLSFFGHPVGIPAMYAILGGSVAALIVGYVLLHGVRQRKRIN